MKDAIPVAMTPRSERGTVQWLAVQTQLREGPNTAKQRGILKRRRARLRRLGHHRIWSYTTVMDMTVRHHEKMQTLVNKDLQTIIDATVKQQGQLLEERDRLMDLQRDLLEKNRVLREKIGQNK